MYFFYLSINQLRTMCITDADWYIFFSSTALYLNNTCGSNFMPNMSSEIVVHAMYLTLHQISIWLIKQEGDEFHLFIRTVEITATNL